MGRSRNRSPARSGADDGWSEAVALEWWTVGLLTDVGVGLRDRLPAVAEPQAASSSRHTLAAAVRRPSAHAALPSWPSLVVIVGARALSRWIAG